MQIPDTEFARAGELHIAYQVFGSGPVELAIAGGPAGHIEVYWEEPLVRRWNERLGSFARVVIFDRRGTGASDAADEPPTLEAYMEDLHTVIDAAGFERPALFGGAEGGSLCALFAATYPERVSALAIMDCAARGTAVLRPDLLEQVERLIEQDWGKGYVTALYAPSMAGDERFRRWGAKLERNSVTPRGARQILQLMATSDITEALPRIQAPTLVMHRRDDQLIPPEEGRALADAIPGARFVELEGTDTMGWTGDADAALDELEEFLTGTRGHAHRERSLSTVLFTDIVGSTDVAARLGDRRWRHMLTEHDHLVRRELDRAGGRVVKSVGDGVLATFDSPADAVRAARSAIDAARPLDLHLRAGLHIGEIELLEDGDIGGLAVHMGARITALAEPEQVLVSGTVRDVLVGSGLELIPNGTHRLRGVPGEWTLYALGDGRNGPPAG
jgi:class 3 adenylate cyclase/alpha-beta hydrolase superfamily lysophospholipase